MHNLFFGVIIIVAPKANGVKHQAPKPHTRRGNMNIKERIRQSGVYQWEVAERIGIGEVTLVKWLRRPEKLDPERLAKIERALEELLRERGEQR